MNAAFTTLLSIPDISKIIEFTTPTLWEWAIQVFNLLLIIWILKKLLFKPVTEFLEKRRLAIAKDINDAKMAKTDANTLKGDYEARLVHINQERDSILKDARQKALTREAQIIEAAHQEAESIKQRALQDIALEEQRVKAEMKQEMLEVATLMAGKFVATSIDQNKQDELVGEIIEEMGDVQWLN